jgi:hypothetical protein
MKNIELTEGHKSKLLEMCKVLFPEYEWDFSFLEREGNIKYWNNEMKNAKFIHWFEFCFNYLCPKIIGEGYSLLVNSFYTQHPVDYLYEKFKQNEKS